MYLPKSGECPSPRGYVRDPASVRTRCLLPRLPVLNFPHFLLITLDVIECLEVNRSCRWLGLLWFGRLGPRIEHCTAKDSHEGYHTINGQNVVK